MKKYCLLFLMGCSWQAEHISSSGKMMSLNDLPAFSQNSRGLQGDPLNIAFYGRRENIQQSMHTIQWKKSDPITLGSSIRIALDTILGLSYKKAPISNLYVFGRKQDIAFEQQLDGSPEKRIHLRLWKTTLKNEQGEALWIGGASLDKGVEFSFRVGITHKIDANLDAVRDSLYAVLEQNNLIHTIEKVQYIPPTKTGENAAGDRYFTDGIRFITRIK